MTSEPTDWMKRILAPVIVAVVVGMATSYLSTAVAIARIDEKSSAQVLLMDKQAAAQAVRVSDHAARIKALEDGKANVIVLEVEMRGIRTQLARIEDKLDKMGEK